MPRRNAPFVIAATAALALTVLAGCGSSDDTPAASSATAASVEPLKVMTSFYPVEEVARAIGGDRVSVADLTPVGGEPHDLELKPPQLAELEDSKLVLYLGDGFQPQVEKAVSSLPSDQRTVDLLHGIELRPAQVGIPGVRGEVDGGAGPRR
jgi:zinc transport system substrate-binding protein